MIKKCLIVYQSLTGNTKKIALKFKSTFERNGWQCDTVRVSKKTNVGTLPSVKDYDFLCLGSGVYGGLPGQEMATIMDILTSPGKMESMSLGTYIDISRPSRLTTNTKLDLAPQTGESEKVLKKGRKFVGGWLPMPHARIVVGPKQGVVFATYGGTHLGPRQAEPTLKYLEVEMEFCRFRCIGSFCCPGRMPIALRPSPAAFHKDLFKRPNERDLLKAEIFIEEKLEEIH